MGTNLKGQYFYKDMGDGTSVSIVRKRRPDDEVWALVMLFKFPGGKLLTCFLEDTNGIPFIQELADGLIDYLEDVSEIDIENSEAAGDDFILRKRETAKKENKKDKWDDIKTTKEETVKN
ncbi:hypothetical protein LCGC14_2725090 [marine sediment metagenome]|uniref:Uncharacterized protein n=1 Tax=marine sediment metagenome TaxID=412755 RepID=A0A0F9BHZ9_9ZZZZ